MGAVLIEPRKKDTRVLGAAVEDMVGGLSSVRAQIKMMTDAEINEIVEQAERKLDNIWNDPDHGIWDRYIYQTGTPRSSKDTKELRALRSYGEEFRNQGPEGAD